MKWLFILFFRIDQQEQKKFSGQLEGEHVELLLTKHWVVLLSFLFKIILAIALLLTFDYYASALLDISFSLILLLNISVLTVIVHVTAVKMVNYFLHVILITNFRVIRKRHTIFLRRDQETMNLQNVQDVGYTQHGLLQRVLDYGEIHVRGVSSDIIFHLHHIPNVSKYCHMVGHIFRNFVQKNLPRTPLGKEIPPQSSTIPSSVPNFSASEEEDTQDSPSENNTRTTTGFE